MSLSLFKKQILLMAAVTLVFLVFGLLASLLVTQMDRQRFEASPTAFLARLADQISDRYHVSRQKPSASSKHQTKPPPIPLKLKS